MPRANTDLATVSAYHEGQLAGLLEHVAEGFERYRRGELDAIEMDHVMHRYSKAARELWKFCWSPGSNPHLSFVVKTLEHLTTEGRSIDWWEEAKPRERR
jgi:hypothetical protein